MSSIESLPADQRAVLELVLRRGRSYDEIANLLSIDRAGVRQRALAALDALGPQTRVPAERRALITDYLLGALPEPVAAEVREHLAQSASERAWARAVGSELQGLGDRPLPEIPTDTMSRAEVAEPVAAEVPVPASAGVAEAGDAAPLPGAPAPTPEPQRPSSRRGGALLLAGAAAVVLAVVLVLVLPGGGGGHKRPITSAQRTTRNSTPSTTSTSPTTSTGAQILAQINLKPPSGGSTPIGVAEVLQVQGRRGVAIAAQGVAANSKHPPNAYAVWLYNSPTDNHRLGFVDPAVSTNGQLRTAGALPGNASRYQKLLVTLETTSNPRTPGRIVLEGTLSGL